MKLIFTDLIKKISVNLFNQRKSVSDFFFVFSYFKVFFRMLRQKNFINLAGTGLSSAKTFNVSAAAAFVAAGAG